MRVSKRGGNQIRVFTPHPHQLEISRPMLLPLSMDLRFLVCEHASLRTVYSQRTRLHSQIRKAHNLSDRFSTLEKSLRPHRQIPKDVIAGVGPVEDISPSPTRSVEVASEATEMEVLNKGGSKSILRPKSRTFNGVLIPVKPLPPASDGTPHTSCAYKILTFSSKECCMSSCTVCVYDLYATALEDHEEALTQARSELSARSIPSEEWPTEVLPEADRKKREEEQRAIQASEGGVEAGRRIGITGESDRDRQMAVIIGAFVKFEQALKEKRKAEKARPQPTAGQHPLGSSSQPSLP
jgi:hypothetical protein